MTAFYWKPPDSALSDVQGNAGRVLAAPILRLFIDQITGFNGGFAIWRLPAVRGPALCNGVTLCICGGGL